MNINEQILDIYKNGKEIENRKLPEILKKYNNNNTNSSVFRIPLDLLKYNLQNGRIATFFIENENKINSLNELEIKNEIKNEIINSDKKSHDKTKNNIKLIGQQEPGIVLLDGTVIDGNRRFTCLLELNQENPNQEEYKYFNAFILNSDNVDEKIIKQLELNIQLAKDEKVNYDIMDRYMDIYNVISLQKKLTIEEYSKYSNMTEKEIQEIIDQIDIMKEYLKYIKKDSKWDIIKRKKKLEHFKEVKNSLNKINSKSEQEAMKQIAFDYILCEAPNADSKSIRELCSSSYKKDKENWNLFILNCEDSDEKIKEVINKNKNFDFDKLESDLKKDEELIKDLTSNFQELNVNNLISEEKNKIDSILTTISKKISSLSLHWNELEEMNNNDPSKLKTIYKKINTIVIELESKKNHIEKIMKKESNEQF